MERVLARDTRGETSRLAVVLEAKAKLSSEELDRFWRAKKVWFNVRTQTFEYEERSL